MTARRRRRLTGLLYVAPAVIFVLVFTAVPLVGMVAMSFTNWSLITPPKFIGLTNFQAAVADGQFWGSLGYTLKYTLLITPILMVGGYLLALLVAPNTPLRRTTRAIIFVPVVIGLGVSSLLWVWLFDPTFGLINRALTDLGLIDKPIQFLGVDADLSTWSIIASVVWKVLGFGVILFVAAIQAIPSEINEATMVDGATLLAADPTGDRAADPPHDPAGHPDQRDRLAPGVRPVLHHDRRPAVQPDLDGRLLHLQELVPVPASRVRGGPVADPGADHPRLHGRPDGPDAPERDVTAVTVRAPVARAWSRVWAGRNRYLVGAVCLTICVFMLTPIVLSMLASVKTTAEAAAIPPTYVPHELSLDSYQRLWSYQAGLPTYLCNSFATAFMTIAFTLALTIPAGYALARFPVPGKELIFVFLLLALIIPYQALLTPIFLMFAQVKLTNTLVGLAIVHTAIQLPFSLYIMRNSFESVPRELEEAALTDGGNSWQILTSIFIPAVVPAIVTVALFAFVTSWNEFLAALVLLSRASTFTLPLILASARAETSLGGTDWGMLQAGITIAMIPCIGIYLLLQKYYVSGLHVRARSSDRSRATTRRSRKRMLAFVFRGRGADRCLGLPNSRPGS